MVVPDEETMRLPDGLATGPPNVVVAVPVTARDVVVAFVKRALVKVPNAEKKDMVEVELVVVELRAVKLSKVEEPESNKLESEVKPPVAVKVVPILTLPEVLINKLDVAVRVEPFAA